MFGFDGQGNNISVFSKLGTGPGEYREIKDVQIDFNCYVQPASLLKHIEESKSFENHPILKSIDFEKIEREDNPILIKFHLE